MNSRIAVCLINSPRNIKECLPTLYKYIIEPWNADVFGVFTVGEHDDDMERISTINAIKKDFYKLVDFEKELPPIFWKTHYKFASCYSDLRFSQSGTNNYLSPIYNAPKGRSHGSMASIFSLYKLYQMMLDIIDDYDFFLVTRTDYCFLFPIFDVNILHQNQDYVLAYNLNEWGGVNSQFLIMNKLNFIKWTNQIKYFIEEEHINQLLNKMGVPLNAEGCSKYIAQLLGLKIKKIDSLSYITNQNTLQPKYIQEFQQVNKNKMSWEFGARWQDLGGTIKVCKQ